MNTKRFISVLLPATLIALALTGCGGDAKKLQAENDALRAEVAALKSRTEKISRDAPGSHGFAARSLRGISMNSDSSRPNGVFGARMNTVRAREPRVSVRFQMISSDVTADHGRMPSGAVAFGMNGDGASSSPNTSR